MLEKILFPTDFSDVADKTLEFIKSLRENGIQEVVVLHVIDERGVDALQRYVGPDKIEEIKQERQEKIQGTLKAIEKTLNEAGMKATLRIESGIPVRRILKVEKEEEVSAIVIGSHGMSNLEEIFLGSVSEKVIKRSTKPVLVIKR